MGTKDKTRLFIGDVHGCADELSALLEKLRFDPVAHSLYFTGDLVNRGPKSLKTLRTAIRLDAGSVLGNHDLHLIGRYLGTRTARPRDTLDKLLADDDVETLIDWLWHQPVIRVQRDLAVVHAGLRPGWRKLKKLNRRVGDAVDWDRDPFEAPDLRFATTVRRCDERGRMPGDERVARDVLAPWDHWYRGKRTIVFGHWAQRGRVRTARVRGLDTGCVWGGRLTAWIAEEDRFVSVKARRAYQRPS